MAEQSKKNSKPSVGFYDEPGFVSLTTSLRKLSGDDTLPTDSYVNIYNTIYDLLTPEIHTTSGGILDITLTKDKKELIIHYSDNSTKKLELEDNYLFQAYYDNISNLIYFVLKNGNKITLDINYLFEQFASKEKVTEIQEEVTEIQEKINEIEDNIEEIKENIDNISSIVDKGTEVKWQSL